MMLLLLICAVLQMVSGTHGASSSGAMMNMATIRELDVVCDKAGMTVTIDFSQPFNGIIFSKGYYSDPACRYVEANSGRDSYVLQISSNTCGSQMGPAIGDDSRTELTNTIIIQNDKDIQEIWDVARKINCEWIDNYVKTVNFNPFTVGMLQAEEVRFPGDQPIECWMDLQLGKYPQVSDINQIVKIGDPLSLLVFARDNEYQYDVAVKDCYAFAGPDYNNQNTPRLQLTDSEGCVLKDKLISPFYLAREDDIQGSTLVTYAHVSAFKFPDVMDVYMTCNVEICKGDCDSKCSGQATTTEPSRRWGSTLFGEPIYTTKPSCTPDSTHPDCPKTTPAPCYPGSPDPSCNVIEPTTEPPCYPGSKNPSCRGKQLFPSPITTKKPKCYPGSEDEDCRNLFPTVPPQTTLKCYPGSLDPKCPLICTEGSPDPRCPKPTTPQPTTTKVKCVSGSLHPDCQYTTGRWGSILFPATITTTPSTTTTQTTTTEASTTPEATTKRRSGGIIFSQSNTTEKPKSTVPPPRLKPKTTTTKSPARGKQLLSEPKPAPEPSGKEWEGNPRYHAFHSYHYQRGDGRRSRVFGQRISPRKRVIRSVEGNEPPRPLLAKVPLQLSRTLHVAPPRDFPVLQVEDTVITSNPPNQSVCLSSIAAIGFSAVFFALLVIALLFVYLYLRQRNVTKS